MEDYVPYYGEVVEEDKCLTEDSDLDIDMMLQYENLQTEMRNKQKMKDFLQGFKFAFRLESIKVSVHTPNIKLVRQ